MVYRCIHQNATAALDLQAYKRRLILSASSSRLLKREGIIQQFTRGNHVVEEEVRRDIKEAMDAGRNNPDPAVRTKWAGFLHHSIRHELARKWRVT